MYSSTTHSLTSALDGDEWSASRLGHFTPRERTHGTHWIGGWVCLTAVLDDSPSNTKNALRDLWTLNFNGATGMKSNFFNYDSFVSV